VPLAALLLALSLPPFLEDVRRSAHLRQLLAMLGARFGLRRKDAAAAGPPPASEH